MFLICYETIFVFSLNYYKCYRLNVREYKYYCYLISHFILLYLIYCRNMNSEVVCIFTMERIILFTEKY